MFPYVHTEIIETLTRKPSPKRMSFSMPNTLTRALPMSIELSIAEIRAQSTILMATAMQLLLRWFL